jgi:hypothetical protein
MLSEVFLTVLLTTGATAATSAPAPMEINDEKENGQVELTVQSGARTVVDDAAHDLLASLEFELGLTDRLELRAEFPLSIRSAEELELGLAYNFLRSDRVTFFAGVDVAPAEPAALILHLQSEIAMAQAEIRVEMTAGLDHEHSLQLDLAAGPEGSQWRGTLELRRETISSEVHVTPGLARKISGSWIGIGIALPHADHSQPSLQLKTGFDF